MKKKPRVFDFSVIRKLRKRDGLTLQDVSDRSGIGLAVLSKLERNLSRAELDTLFRVAKVFGLTVADLIALAEERTAQVNRGSSHRSGDFSFREIRYGNIRCLEGRAPNGARVSRPEVHRDDYEICWVLDGVLRVEMPNERYNLASGESLQFDAVWEHTYEALADCRFLIIHLPKENRF
jgi:transcriptional regulator with XRE-family HTH domain